MLSGVLYERLYMIIYNMKGMHISLFSCVVGFVHGLASFLFMYFSLKALYQANFSVFSVFSMLGGVLPPFFYGILLAPEKEPVTVGKVVCCTLIIISLICTLPGGKVNNK